MQLFVGFVIRECLGMNCELLKSEGWNETYSDIISNPEAIRWRSPKIILSDNSFHTKANKQCGIVFLNRVQGMGEV